MATGLTVMSTSDKRRIGSGVVGGEEAAGHGGSRRLKQSMSREDKMRCPGVQISPASPVTKPNYGTPTYARSAQNVYLQRFSDFTLTSKLVSQKM